MGKLTNYYPAKNWKNKEARYEYRYDFLERMEDSISSLGEHKRVFRNFEGNIVKEIHSVSYQEQKENGEGTCYEYDKDGNCIRIHYPDGGTERCFYDADGNLLRQILPESYQPETDNRAGYSYIYDKKNRLVTICDPDGKELHHYEYNGHDQVTRDIDGEGKEILSGYDGLGQKIWEKISIRKENEETFYRMIAYHYDQQGNKIKESYGNEEVTKDQTPFTWHSIYFSYDKNNHLIQVKDNDGAKVRYDYDCLGNRTLEEQTIAEGIQKRIHYRYNKNGWRICKEEEMQGNGEIRFAITSYEYDENGNLTKIRTPKGFEIQRTYDSNDHLITEHVIDKKHGIDRTIILTYDATGNLIGETLQGAGLKALKREYQYDLKDRLTHKINTSGAITKYIYDKNNHLIKEINPYGYHKETDDGIGTLYHYDSRGNLIRETNLIFHNPILGRFMQEDVYQGDGLNLYAYCDNNPVMYYDPSGYTEENASVPCSKPENGGDPGERENINGSSVESASNTTRVGRWMSKEEYDEMFLTKKVQMSGDNKVHVAKPADINAFGKQAPKGSLYVEFDVPSNTISKGGRDGWGIINGPGSLLDRFYKMKGLPRITEMPNATNIKIEGSNMSDYNYEIIKTSVIEWYEKILSELKNSDEIILSKSSGGALIIDFDFENCIAQLSVTNSQYVPYKFVYFEAIDIENTNLIYCFYDDDTMQKVDVISALDKALIFCSNYKVK